MAHKNNDKMNKRKTQTMINLLNSVQSKTIHTEKRHGFLRLHAKCVKRVWMQSVICFPHQYHQTVHVSPHTDLRSGAEGNFRPDGDFPVHLLSSQHCIHSSKQWLRQKDAAAWRWRIETLVSPHGNVTFYEYKVCGQSMSFTENLCTYSVMVKKLDLILVWTPISLWKTSI